MTKFQQKVKRFQAAAKYRALAIPVGAMTLAATAAPSWAATTVTAASGTPMDLTTANDQVTDIVTTMKNATVGGATVFVAVIGLGILIWASRHVQHAGRGAGR